MSIITSVLPILEGGSEYRVTSPFGVRGDPMNPAASQMHYGIDLTLWRGWSALAYICAAWDGEVIRMDYDSSRGNYVIIDHGDGVQTHYYHMARDTVKVRAGEHVTSGQQLGYMGNTGASTGAHLHFQLEIDGVPVDPLPFITGEVPEPSEPPSSVAEPDGADGGEFDNTPAEWAEEAVTWAVEHGILYGDETGNYRLHEPCTREMMLVFLHRAMGGRS